MSRRAPVDVTGVIAWALLVALVVGVIALGVWARAAAPCAWFTVAEAPVRCLPGADQ